MTSPIAEAMNSLVKLLTRSGLLAKDLDYHLIRVSIVIIFLLFGYQKWFAYEATVLIPFISHDPLISWMYPAFGIQGASWLLGVSEWTFGALLFLGFLGQEAGNSRSHRIDDHVRESSSGVTFHGLEASPDNRYRNGSTWPGGCFKHRTVEARIRALEHSIR